MVESEEKSRIRKLKEEAYDLAIMIGLHEEAIRKLQEKLDYLDRQIAGGP